MLLLTYLLRRSLMFLLFNTRLWDSASFCLCSLFVDGDRVLYLFGLQVLVDLGETRSEPYSWMFIFDSVAWATNCSFFFLALGVLNLDCSILDITSFTPLWCVFAALLPSERVLASNFSYSFFFPRLFSIVLQPSDWVIWLSHPLLSIIVGSTPLEI